MKRGIALDTERRAAPLGRYRKDHGPGVRSRPHVLLPLDDRQTWAAATPLSRGGRTIDRRVERHPGRRDRGVGRARA